MWTQNSSLKEDSTFLFGVIFETSNVFSQSLLFWSYFKTWPRIKLEEQVPSIYHLTKISLFFFPFWGLTKRGQIFEYQNGFLFEPKKSWLEFFGILKDIVNFIFMDSTLGL